MIAVLIQISIFSIEIASDTNMLIAKITVLVLLIPQHLRKLWKISVLGNCFIFSIIDLSE